MCGATVKVGAGESVYMWSSTWPYSRRHFVWVVCKMATGSGLGTKLNLAACLMCVYYCMYVGRASPV